MHVVKKGARQRKAEQTQQRYKVRPIPCDQYLSHLSVWGRARLLYKHCIPSPMHVCFRRRHRQLKQLDGSS